MPLGGVLAAYTLGAMYEVTVELVFREAHAITLTGQREQTHEHDWRVRVVVGGQEVNHDGVLCDFHWLQRQLDVILAPLENQDLNAVAPFDRVNPTAEHVARHIAEAIGAVLPAGLALHSATVTEAPGCTATYRPQRPRSAGGA